MENRTETSFLNTEGRAIKALNLYAGIGGNRKLWPENILLLMYQVFAELHRLAGGFETLNLNIWKILNGLT